MSEKGERERESTDASRRKRIAAGAGVTVEDVNKLMKQYEQMKKMFKQMSGKAGKRKLSNMRMPGGMPPGFPGM